MKQIFNISKFRKGLTIVALSAMLVGTTTSCEVTDLQPAAQLSEETAFATPERIELTVIGMYNAAAIGFYLGSYTAARGYPFGAAVVQQNEMRGEDMLNQALFYQITYEAAYTPFSANNVEYWNNLYAVINQANVVIEGVEGAVANGTVTAEVGNAYIGEAKAMRAMAHHELLLQFARPYADNAGTHPGVPYRDFAVNSPASVEQANTLGRGTVAEDYAKILADLDAAEQVLPETRATRALTISRFTKGAAIALKTRVKLHQQDWNGVIAEGNKLITGGGNAAYTSPIGGYQLAASPETPFTAFSNNTESILSMAQSEAANPGVNGALPSMFGNPAQGGRGLVRVSPIIYNNPFWLPNDIRRQVWLTNERTFNPSATNRSYYLFKYRNIAQLNDWTPLIRYAEVLLNVAEAEARLNPLSVRALDLLNAVRNRSVPTASDRYTIANFTTQGSLLNAIWQERRIELIGEGFRWRDIHRLSPDPASPLNGVPSKMTFAEATFNMYDLTKDPNSLPRSIPAIPYSDPRFLWPIPASELAQNPTLAGQQNPGY